MTQAREALASLQRQLARCRRCPRMVGPPVHGGPVLSRVLLVGQAPGRHEGRLGRPFAWTAGKRLFRWFEERLGVDEARVRERVYFAAVARCFPGKAEGGGDRRPDPEERVRCRPFLEREASLLRPGLVIPVGGLAIAELFGEELPLATVVGTLRTLRLGGTTCEAIALPHPSGASTWHRTEPGRTLLRRALARIGAHPAWRASVSRA